MVDCDKQADQECKGKSGAQFGYCRGVVKNRCLAGNAKAPAPSPPKDTGCGAGRVWDGKQCRDPKNPAPVPSPPKDTGCGAGRVWDGKQCRDPKNPPPSKTPAKSPSKTPAKSPGSKKCNEWVQRGGSLPSTADRLVHYANCTKRLYCKDGKKHEFKVGQTPNVNACGGGETTEAGCPKLTNGSLFCDFKFSDSSKISGYPIKSDSWTDCQRKCWDHGDACQGWWYKTSTKECTLGTQREKKEMKHAKGFIGGPRWDVQAGPLGTSDGTAPVDTTNNTESFYDDDVASEGGVTGWIKENKTTAIVGILVILLSSMMVSAGGMMMMM